MKIYGFPDSFMPIMEGGGDTEGMGFTDNITHFPNEATELDPAPSARIVMFPREATIFAAICCIIFIVVGIIGNVLTMLALSSCIKLRNATTAFVISLCAADLIFCSFNLPLTASRYIHESWILGDTLCALFPFFFYGNVAVSLLSMTAITINRYILIAHHTLYDTIYKRRNIGLMIAFLWLFSFSMLVPPLTGVWGKLGYSRETFSCTILHHNGRSPKKFLFVFGFLLPFVVIVISYSCIYYKVRQSRHNVSSHSVKSPKSPTRVQRKEDLRLTRLMFIIFCSFISCFLPLMIVNVFDEDDMRYPVLHVIASILAWASSCINPLIYAALSRQYRQAYVRLLCPRRKGRSPSGSTSRSNSGKTGTTDVFAYNATNNTCTMKTNGNTESAKENGV